jgi:hypothetical protein
LAVHGKRLTRSKEFPLRHLPVQHQLDGRQYPDPLLCIVEWVDPNSVDNSICWMRKAEFDKLKSKDDWRRKFAVWASWNSNGEFVTYTVPPGKGLNLWEGVVGVQKHKGNEIYKLEGGAVQLVLDPKELKKEYLGKRQSTGWGYSSFGETVELTGVPVLTNNWMETK